MALRKCPRCNGRGKLYSIDAENSGGGASLASPFVTILEALTDSAETCPLCKGRGHIDDGTIDIRVRHRYDE